MKIMAKSIKSASILSFLVGAALLTGCVSAGEGDRMAADIKLMKDEVGQLRASMDADRVKLNETLTRAQRNVEQLEATLEDARQRLGRNNADLSADMEAMRKEIDRVSGQLDVGRREFEQLRKAFELFQADVDVRLNSRRTLPSDPDELFQAGQDRLSGDDPDGARKAFERFAKDFPSDDRADNAVFFVGESFMKQEKYKEAAASFRAVLKDYEKSDIRDAATYRFGDALVGMKRCDDARIFYEEVTTKFKKSSFKKDARQKLKQIDKKQLCP